MKHPLLLFLSILIFSITTSCGSNNYADGTYCADVKYYNPKTGTKSNYTLNVKVEDNYLVTMYWNNGGRLDKRHFSSAPINYKGYCSFTSNRNYKYEVKIIGERCR